jgi:hypothetical protein
MKNKFITITLLLIALITFSSCDSKNEYDDSTPQNTINSYVKAINNQYMPFIANHSS